MHCRKFFLLALFLTALFCAGCGSKQTSLGPKESHLLGLVKYEKANYSATGPNTFAIHSDEIFTRRDFSGDKVTLLWGLVALKDY